MVKEVTEKDGKKSKMARIDKIIIGRVKRKER